MAEHEIAEQAKRIRYDLTVLQAKVTELLQMAAKLPASNADKRTCPDCGLHAKALPQGTTLADHRRNVHDHDPDNPEPGVSTTTSRPANVTP